MKRYYVNTNAQPNGDHEVHNKTCIYFPSNAIDLKEHPDCHAAVRAAKIIYTQSNGCAFCCPACHTS